MKALVDLDPFVYKAGFAGQKTTRIVLYQGNPVAELASGERLKTWCKGGGYDPAEIEVKSTVKPEPLGNVLHSAKLMLKTVQTDLKLDWDDMELYLTGTGNFRYDIYPEYKASRKDLEKPIHYQAIRDYYVNVLGAFVIDGMEADDMCSIRATELEYDGVIVSIDKDLKQVAGSYYNPDKPEEGVVEIDPWTADFNFYCQLLTGDRSDDIPGISGLGPKKAAKLLEDCDDEREMYKVCARVYYESGVGDDEIIVRNAQLLYMLREKGVGWQPPI